MPGGGKGLVCGRRREKGGRPPEGDATNIRGDPRKDDLALPGASHRVSELGIVPRVNLAVAADEGRLGGTCPISPVGSGPVSADVVSTIGRSKSFASPGVCEDAVSELGRGVVTD